MKDQVPNMSKIISTLITPPEICCQLLPVEVVTGPPPRYLKSAAGHCRRAGLVQVDSQGQADSRGQADSHFVGAGNNRGVAGRPCYMGERGAGQIS